MGIRLQLIVFLTCLRALGLAQDPCDLAPVFTSGATMCCQGSSQTFSVAPVPGVDVYIWSLDGWPPIQESASPTLAIEFGPSGTIELCVVTKCSSGAISPPSCLTIAVTPAPITILDTLFVCAEDTLKAGNQPGTYDILLVTPEGCDSLVIKTIAVIPEGPVDLGTILLCPGDQWQLNGIPYEDSGDYVVYDNLPFAPYCFSEMRFSILPFTSASFALHANPPKSPGGSTTLSIHPVHPGLSSDYVWSGPNGFAALGPNIVPPVSGEYCVTASLDWQSDPTTSCEATKCLSVKVPMHHDTNDTPGEADPDGSDGMKPWIYPLPASDHFCIAWPQTDLHNATWTLYNRWGSLVQHGSLDHGCAGLVPPAPDVYVLVLLLEDGNLWSTPLTVQ